MADQGDDRDLAPSPSPDSPPTAAFAIADPHVPEVTSAATRSRRAATCPFLRAVDEDDLLTFPIETADSANRCAAFGAPMPQSTRQQELVCLQASHANCPRYLRGVLVAQEERVGATAAVARPVESRTLTRATVGALGVLGLSATIAVAFVIRSGGLSVPLAVGQASPTAVAALPSAAASVSPAESVAPSISVPSPSALAPSPSAVTPSPSVVAPSPSVEPSSSPASPSATPRSDRYALLTPCPNKPRCYIYVVRVGDNLFSIAHYFGVPLQTVYRLNPGVQQTGIRSGMKLVLPPPTR